MPCELGLLARFAIWPAYFKQTRGRPEPPIERLVVLGRDERQMLAELWGRASCSVGHEANSGDGGRNLPRAIGRTGFLRCRWLISVEVYIFRGVQ
jgi:hypothetical protein